ncbi:MAG TPA: TIGR02677 family protein [Streptosporangiaceae bacterium]
MAVVESEVDSFDLDAIEVSDRFRLFGFTRRDDYLAYLWVLRAMDRLRGAHVAQAHSDDVAEVLAEFAAAHDTVPGNLTSLRSRLDNLTDDGILHRLEDASRAGSLARYRNRQSVYQFSELGHRAYTAVEGVLAARVQDANLSRLVFPDILRDMRGLAEANRAGDGEEIVRRLTSLDRVMEDMARRSARFHLTLGDITRSTDASPETFLRYKHALLAHMSDFMAELDRYLPRLALAVAQVESTGIGTLLNRAAEADERPLMQYDDVINDWRRRWAAVRAWFSADGEASRAAELAAATRAGVSSVIALLRQITEAQRGGVNRATQLRHLAAWAFDSADEDAAHALMGAAFGLRRARHLGGVHEDSELISPRLSWHDAPGIEVAVTLFRRGKAPTPGVPQRLQAADGVRADLRRRQAARRAAEHAAARQLLSAGLGDRVLDESQTRVLLTLLARALEARSVVAGRITAGSGGNDVMTIRLVPSRHGSLVRTEHGVLHLPGLRLEISPARPAAGGLRTAAAAAWPGAPAAAAPGSSDG